MNIEQEIDDQLARFQNHPGLSGDEYAATAQANEIRKAFRKHCRTVQAVAEVGEALMERCKYFPLPVDVEMATDAVRKREVRRITDFQSLDVPACGCGGTGWRSYANADGVSFAKRCSCAKVAQ